MFWKPTPERKHHTVLIRDDSNNQLIKIDTSSMELIYTTGPRKFRDCHYTDDDVYWTVISFYKSGSGKYVMSIDNHNRDRTNIVSEVYIKDFVRDNESQYAYTNFLKNVFGTQVMGL